MISESSEGGCFVTVVSGGIPTQRRRMERRAPAPPPPPHPRTVSGSGPKHGRFRLRYQTWPFQDSSAPTPRSHSNYNNNKNKILMFFSHAKGMIGMVAQWGLERAHAQTSETRARRSVINQPEGWHGTWKRPRSYRQREPSAIGG